MNGGPLVRPLLTPGLTPLQAARLRDDLARLTRLPQAPAVYIDADRIAGRYMVSPHAADHQLACSTVAQLIEEHRHDRTIVAWIAGMAHGVRLGKRFSPPPVRRSKWISAEYRQLPEPLRRDVQRYIRQLLKAQNPPRPPAPSAHDEGEAARRWSRDMGKLGRERARHL